MILLFKKVYLIHIKLGNDVVKEGVQIIEQFHNLKRVIKGDQMLLVKLMLVDLVLVVVAVERRKENFTSRAVLDEERAVKPELMWM